MKKNLFLIKVPKKEKREQLTLKFPKKTTTIYYNKKLKKHQ